VRLSRPSLAIAVPFILSLCGCATDILGPTPAVEGKLTDVETEYVEAMEYAYAVAGSVPLDVDKAIRQNIDAALSGESAKANMLQALNEAHFVLSTLAATIRETGPYTMDSLAPTNEGIAAILEGAYVGCIEVVEKETSGPAPWASNALGFLLGVPDLVGDPGASTTARARVLACVGEHNNAVRKAADEGLAALRAKENEIVSGRRQEAQKGVGCFIATAAYGSSDAAEIDILRSFRDDVLLRSDAGCDYVDFYYAASPPLARFIAEREWLRTIVREVLVEPVVAVARSTQELWSEPQRTHGQAE
jgi:hypothetical protein